MDHDEKTIMALEGRILAHRRLLAQLLAILPEAEWKLMADWLSESTLLQDGQEDPGAVPIEGLELELTMAEEYRELAALTQGLRDRS